MWIIHDDEPVVAQMGVAACCSVLQRVAVCCSTLQCVAVCGFLIMISKFLLS